MQVTRVSLIVLLVPALVSAMATAATLHVPGDCPTIQGAIDAANDGDEIVVAPATYAEQLDLLGKSIILRGSGGADETTIDGSSFTGPIIQCVSGEPIGTTIEGFLISGANQTRRARDTTHGGGLFIVSSSPTVVHCTFEGNFADFGGAIYCLQSEATIADCAFRSNTCSEKGGALRCYDSAPMMTSCQFSTNAASIHGGVIASNENSAPVLGDSHFCENEPDDVAGPWTDAGGNVFDGACCPADLFDDGMVNVIDFLALLAAWGVCPTDEPCPADLDGDGEVNVGDLLVLLAAWGPCS